MGFDFEPYRSAFKVYVKAFAGPDGTLSVPMEQKFIHTDQVAATAIRIMDQDGTFSEREYRLSLLAALFHDVSRFEQFQKFETFRDDKSYDHGKRSAELLTEEHFIDDLPEDERRTVAEAVAVHNKVEIPGTFSANALKIAKLTRDADKLAIIHLILAFFNDTTGTLRNDKTMKLDMPDTPGFSEKIVRDILDGKNIMHSDMKNLNDFKLTIFSWVNDLNFPASAGYALEHRLYPELRKLLPESKLLDDLLLFAEEKLYKLKRKEVCCP